MLLGNSSKLPCTLIAGSGNEGNGKEGSLRNNGGWHLLPQCLSAPSQGHCLCQLNIFTIPFKLLSELIISETTHIFLTLPWRSFSAIQSNSLEPFLDTKPLVLHRIPKCGIETMWKEALQKSYLTTDKDKITEKTRTSHQSCPCQGAHVLLWAKLSEVRRGCGHCGGPGCPWLSWIVFGSPAFSFPGWKAQLHLGISLLRFRKCTITALFHIYLCSVSVWEENLKGYFSDIVYHLIVINKTTDAPGW